MPETVSEDDAKKLLHAVGIEAIDDPRTYKEIAEQFGLLAMAETTELTMPRTESKV